MASASSKICCCGIQKHIQAKDEQILLKHPENHLRNLAITYQDQTQGRAIYDIREFFHNSQIPFRWRGCVYGNMSCCGSCTHDCDKRCPQDVLTRVYLLCANIFDAKDDQERVQRLERAPTITQMVYAEITSSEPKYFVLAEMISELIVSGSGKPRDGEIYVPKDNSYKYDYAPAIEYETIPGTQGETRKKVNVETGEVSVLHWPRSGLCPFCLPVGLTNRRRCKRSF